MSVRKDTVSLKVSMIMTCMFLRAEVRIRAAISEFSDMRVDFVPSRR
jgi:hypothetical protein